MTLEEIEREAILRALAEEGGHRGRMCARLGISRPTLQRKLASYESKPEPEPEEPGLSEEEVASWPKVTLELPTGLAEELDALVAAEDGLTRPVLARRLVIEALAAREIVEQAVRRRVRRP